MLDGGSQDANSLQQIYRSSVASMSTTTPLRRKRQDTLRPQTDSATSADPSTITVLLSPSIAPHSKTKRRKFYCGICNDDFSNTPLKHIGKHLVDVCPSARAEVGTASGSEDRVDSERLLFGCGYCGGRGKTERYHGEAFLGLDLLATHIYEKHSTPSMRLTWDINKAINNVLTSRVFVEDYESLRRSIFCLPSSTPLLWRWGSDTETLLYKLEKLGGSLMGAQEDISPLDNRGRVQITATLNKAFIPIQRSSFVPQGQVVTRDRNTTTATFNLDSQATSQAAPLPKNMNSFARGLPTADPLSVYGIDAFRSRQTSQPFIDGPPIDESMLNYGFSSLDSNGIPDF